MTPRPMVTDESACSGSECFALRVLGEDMAPEFLHGEIIVIEPGGAVKDGSYVLAQVGGEWLFRQLRQHAHMALADLGAVHGVVIQKAVPGRRKLSRFYV